MKNKTMSPNEVICAIEEAIAQTNTALIASGEAIRALDDALARTMTLLEALRNVVVSAA